MTLRVDLRAGIYVNIEDKMKESIFHSIKSMIQAFFFVRATLDLNNDTIQQLEGPSHVY